MPSAAGRPFEAAEPATPEIEPVDLAPDAVLVDPARALREVPGLHDITLRFRQDEFGRVMAAGQAIMLCRSPQEALRLQISYVQAALTAGFAHAKELTRLFGRIAPKMPPSRRH
jgi:hypothetical protein